MMELVPVKVNLGFEDERATNGPNSTPLKNYAITVRHAHTQYTRVLKKITSGGAPATSVILNNFNMTVEKGHIYALLGASGCGKTTILRAVIGRHKLTSGEIRVLGHLIGTGPNVRTSGSSISRASIGYMPQETSLLLDFTVMEIFSFYGKLVGMTKEAIKVETSKLARLLELPPINRIVSTLSGGQQRRVSFAVALLHNPPILILDEPTVGLDPVLRESIWNYLKTVQGTGSTVIITTHYTAEATQADTVGLMRHGTLMAEQSPHKLIKFLGCCDLEEVTLKLALMQSTKHRPISSVCDSQERTVLLPVNDLDLPFDSANTAENEVPPCKRIWALIWKDAVWLLRNPMFAIFLIALPLVVVVGVFFVTRNPTGMHISVFNQDANCFIQESQTIHVHRQLFNCSMPANLSCEILSYLKKKEIMSVISESEESALDDVRRGKSWGAMIFAKNFSSALMERLQYTSLTQVTEEMVDTGTIRVTLDQSDRIISFTIQAELLRAVLKLLSDYDDVCHTIRHIKNTPMQYQPPVYGYFETSNTDYVYPAVITALSFVLPLTSTLVALLGEKLGGTLERSVVSGVNLFEIIIANFLVNVPITIVQMFILLLIPYKVLNIYFAGSISLSALLLLYLGNAGMILGLVIALLSPTMIAGASIALGLYFMFLFTGGLAWPLDGVPSVVRAFCYSMPLTYPSEALRHISQRGWSLLHRTPQLAFTTITVWTLIFLVALMILLRNNAL